VSATLVFAKAARIFMIGLELRVKIKVVIHDAEEGGFPAEVPVIPTQGDAMEGSSPIFTRRSRAAFRLGAAESRS